MSQSADRRPSTVNHELMLNSPERSTSTREPKRRPRRRRREVENDDFARFAVRIIRAHGRRIAEGHVEGLADLLAMIAELDEATQVCRGRIAMPGVLIGRDRLPPGHLPAERPSEVGQVTQDLADRVRRETQGA